MGKPSFTGAVVYLDTTVLDKISAELQPKAKKIVEKYGVVMTGAAAANAPLDTGALRNSITSQSGMTGDLQYTISDGVEYGMWVEFGTSRMAAQPFMTPAVETWKDRFLAAFAGLFK